MSVCFKNCVLDVTEVQPDMPLDQAVYDPVRDVIFGVRGGYIQEYSNAGVATTNRARISVPPFSDSSIAYNPVDDRLYLAHWYDPGDSQGAGSTPNGQRIYTVNPATLSVEASFDVSVANPGGIYNMFFCGPHRIVIKSGIIYGIMWIGGGGRGGYVFSYNPVTTTYVETVTNELFAGWGGLAVNGTEIWFCAADDQRIYHMDPASFSGAYFAPFYAVGTSIFDLCVNPTNGRAYCTTKTGTIKRVSNVGAVLADLNLPGVNQYVLCIRYNPNDSKIYAPDIQNNSVHIIDPNNADSVTTQSGFDSPVDMVFSPTKKFAVQQGTAGLKEVL